jgi:hypothetical protein
VPDVVLGMPVTGIDARYLFARLATYRVVPLLLVESPYA